VSDQPTPEREAYETSARPRRGVVVCASTRAATGVYPDLTGPLIVDALRQWGFDVNDATVVADGEPLGEALRASLDLQPAVLVTTGGTGISPTDSTPELTRRLLDREVPGIAEAIRAVGVAKGVPTAMLSRGVAGVAGSTLVVNLPGSTGAVRDALDLLADVLPHAVDQIRGGDHTKLSGGDHTRLSGGDHR
jgi:molybdenum cofactor synthesis domain-containing protein